MKVLFAPDYRAGVGYQTLLAEALGRQGVEVAYLQTYRRGFPLARQVRHRHEDLLHLHWPEAYFRVSRDWRDTLRQWRFPLDLWLATRGKGLVTTAHNLYPHDMPITRAGLRAESSAYRLSNRVIAHSQGAKAELVAGYGVGAERVDVIPHGNLASSIGVALTDKRSARQALDLPTDGIYLLMFGRVQPYKGIGEVVRFWRDEGKDSGTLFVAGEPSDPAFGDEIARLCSDSASVRFLPKRLSEDELRTWLAACSCAVFNYKQILTSGAASLARSYGVPVCLPERLHTLDLLEPDERVFRFSNLKDISSIARRAETIGSDFQAAHRFRRSCNWDQIAKQTLATYRLAIGGDRKQTNSRGTKKAVKA